MIKGDNSIMLTFVLMMKQLINVSLYVTFSKFHNCPVKDVFDDFVFQML
jgi:hypothetical protein